MPRRYTCSAYLTIAVVLVITGVCVAEWVTDGIPICTADFNQIPSGIVSDGAGGAIIVWGDPRIDFFESDIYAQRVTGGGTTVWPENGLVLSSESNRQVGPVATTDGQGGAICVWQDHRNDPYIALYAQRVSHLGMKWNTHGAPICTVSTANPFTWAIAPDGIGGAFIAWSDIRNGQFDVYAQHIDIGGNPLWISDGVPVSTGPLFQWVPDLVTDGAGGAIVAWIDTRNGSNDIYAQRVDASGNTVWGPDDVPLATETFPEYRSNIVTDGAGGAIVCWGDETETGDVHAERLDADGNYMWGSPGITVCDAAGHQGIPQQVAWGEGGIIVTWPDGRNDAGDIYAQRLDGNGDAMWTPNGVVVCDAANLQSVPFLTVADESSVIIVWTDNRDGNSDVYAQKVESTGVLQWDPAGVAVCTEPGNQLNTYITTDGDGGAIITWRDPRNGFDDIYAQRIHRNGVVAAIPAPTITSVLDVPDDNGGWVNLQWERSYLDAPPDTSVTHYSIWRRLPVGSKTDRDDARRIRFIGDQFAWEWLEDVPAHQFEYYSQTTPTQQDSLEGDPHWQFYMVSAETGDAGVFYDSAPDSGYSIDNLAPAVPENFHLASATLLAWNASADVDFDYFTVYGSASSVFDESAQLIEYTTGTEMDISVAIFEFYHLTATDFAGNESDAATVENVTSSAESVPNRMTLWQNVPNPFNPRTTIAFDLPVPVPVALRIYDLSGRLVRTLASNEIHAAGRHRVDWAGRDARGQAVAAGMYFYRLEAGDFSESRRMTLVR